MKRLLTILFTGMLSTQAVAIDNSRPYYPPRGPYDAGRCGWYYGTPYCPPPPRREWQAPRWPGMEPYRGSRWPLMLPDRGYGDPYYDPRKR